MLLWFCSQNPTAEKRNLRIHKLSLSMVKCCVLSKLYWKRRLSGRKAWCSSVLCGQNGKNIFIFWIFLSDLPLRASVNNSSSAGRSRQQRHVLVQENAHIYDSFFILLPCDDSHSLQPYLKLLEVCILSFYEGCVVLIISVLLPQLPLCAVVLGPPPAVSSHPPSYFRRRFNFPLSPPAQACGLLFLFPVCTVMRLLQNNFVIQMSIKFQLWITSVFLLVLSILTSCSHVVAKPLKDGLLDRGFYYQNHNDFARVNSNILFPYVQYICFSLAWFFFWAFFFS